MTRPIAITGAEGLIGRALTTALVARGRQVAPLDLRATDEAARGDVRDRARVASLTAGCTGIVHLAAVSRVVDGQRDPELCWSTNVGGTRAVLEAAVDAPHRPWVIFASSREVYGAVTTFPVDEDVPLRPINVYGRAKQAGEELTLAARAQGLTTAVVRLSNVFGSANDHVDRVVPAFARAAVRGLPLRVEGAGHTFDFTHTDDVTRGLIAVIERLERSDVLPPLQLVSGVATTLGELAALAVELGGAAAPITFAPPRDYDVAGFVGSPTRARELLDWSTTVALRDGLARLMAAIRAQREP